MDNLFQKLLAFTLFLCSFPLLLTVYILVKINDGEHFIFKQKRVGKNGEEFVIYKLRTMIADADNIKSKYRQLNEADGPVFKIYDDPRYTRIGQFLAHTGLDELPQLINIIKGEMAFVGPRPLPVDEARRIPKKYRDRFTVLPGITSSWIVEGAHKLTFDKWMTLDLEYIHKKSFIFDIKLSLLTGLLMLKLIAIQIIKFVNKSK